LSEIFKNTSANVTLTIDGTTADEDPTAVLHRGDSSTTLPVSGGQVTEDAQVWQAYIGIEHTQESGYFYVEWTFSVDGTPVTKQDWFDVVRPYVTVAEARRELEIPAHITDDQILRVERKMRAVVDSFTGQNFDITTETKLVKGNNGTVLMLPARLSEVTGFGIEGRPPYRTNFRIADEGWSIVATSPYMEGDEIVVNGIIYNPYQSARRFSDSHYWQITGKWGWPTVPTPVKEAMLILIEQELCPNSIYRDRFVEAITGADWRLQFHKTAYEGTGSVYADLLLAPYKVGGIAII
jgi:hypothetical protein